MNFSTILNALKQGKKVYRAGWNGKNMWLMYVPCSPMYTFNSGDSEYSWQDFIAMKTADDTIVPWTPSQTCLLAEDWEILKDE